MLPKTVADEPKHRKLGKQPFDSNHESRIASPSTSDAEPIRKVALVSHDYNTVDSKGLFDYSEHFARINRLCDAAGCDTILYALYTWDVESKQPKTIGMFDGLANVRRIVLEVADVEGEIPGYVEVWRSGEREPHVCRQRFASSSDPKQKKEAFIEDLPNRRIADGLLMLCGESNIANVQRGTDEFRDAYSFNNWLSESNVGVIFNPIHDYMTRYEMKRKRAYYSESNRTVLSVWNRGKGKESKLPWTAFHSGLDCTDDVKDLSTPFLDRPDIRIGIFDIPSDRQ